MKNGVGLFCLRSIINGSNLESELEPEREYLREVQSASCRAHSLCNDLGHTTRVFLKPPNSATAIATGLFPVPISEKFINPSVPFSKALKIVA